MSTETKTQVNVQQAVPFFWVSNIEASLRFYVEGVGFETKHRWYDEDKLRWCWLQIGDASLMLQEYRKAGLEAAQIRGKFGNGVSICFMCKDALAIYREVTARGIPAKEPFVGNHLWVVGVTDPDGYQIDFESPTDVREETKYSEWSGEVKSS
jgi:catechol 2,3-dioxygenase-like lactoylglutathione lyase family enzyme